MESPDVGSVAVDVAHPWTLLAAQLRSDPARPLVTYLGAQGRTELSVATLANNVAKAASLLRDEYDVEPGSAVGLGLPVHWQAPVWLGALAATGAVAVLDPGRAVDLVVATAELLPAGSGAPALRVGTHPFGLPSDDPLPPHTVEAAVELRAQPDVFSPSRAPELDDVATRDPRGDRTQRDVVDDALALVESRALGRGARLLVTAGHLRAEVVPLLLALPLLIEGQVVLAADALDLDAVMTHERVDAVL